jgi:hypothetical protein
MPDHDIHDAHQILWRRLGRILVMLTGGILLSAVASSPIQSAHAQGSVPRQRSAARVLPASTHAPGNMPVALHRFALNVWLAVLMDDAVPGRWTEIALDHMCGPSTRVLIDGKPMVVGAKVPARPFTLQWDMDACFLFGGSIQFSGHVELRVTPYRSGFSALVIPDFETTSNKGQSWVHERFTPAPLLTR